MGFVFDCPPPQMFNRITEVTQKQTVCRLYDSFCLFLFVLYINIRVIIKSRSLVVHLPSIYMFTSCLVVLIMANYVAGP